MKHMEALSIQEQVKGDTQYRLKLNNLLLEINEQYLEYSPFKWKDLMLGSTEVIDIISYMLWFRRKALNKPLVMYDMEDTLKDLLYLSKGKAIIYCPNTDDIFINIDDNPVSYITSFGRKMVDETKEAEPEYV